MNYLGSIISDLHDSNLAICRVRVELFGKDNPKIKSTDANYFGLSNVK